MRYYASFGYKSSDAFMNSRMQNINNTIFGLNWIIPITDWLETSVQYGGFMTNRNYPTVDTYYLTGWSTLIPPTQPSFWPTENRDLI
jgi:hypothetical protein